jgi:hypothetical protein
MTFLFSKPYADSVLLEERAAELLASRPAGYPTGDEMRANTAKHGCDLATAIAHRCILDEPENREFLRRLASLPVAASPGKRNLRIVIVPTMYHQERPELGGDGRLIAGIAERFGISVETIRTSSLGGIEENATTIAHALTRGGDVPIWIVTISKGSADLKRALIRHPELAKRLMGWINIAGMPGGSMHADPKPGGAIGHAMLQGWLLLRGASAGMLAEVGRSHAYSRAGLTLPSTIEVVNVVPMPLSCHLRKPVDKWASYLADFGPNDGYVLLEDALILPGRICPIWGADHYLRVPEFNTLLYRLIAYASGALDV